MSRHNFDEKHSILQNIYIKYYLKNVVVSMKKNY